MFDKPIDQMSIDELRAEIESLEQDCDGSGDEIDAWAQREKRKVQRLLNARLDADAYGQRKLF